MRWVLFWFGLVTVANATSNLTPPENEILDTSIRPSMQVDFTQATLPSWITSGGGANGTRFNSGGALVSATAPRLDYDPLTLAVIGTLNEPGATNVLLYDRDMTNADWVKNSTTAALNQTGLDGSASTASSLTATGSNAITCQSVTLASSVRAQSAYLKRITGTGEIDMATNATTTAGAGATWGRVDCSGGFINTAGNCQTTNWSRVSIPTATVTNPIICFRIVTNGDAIAVDGVQNETTAVTSPILTTTTSVTRTADTFIGSVANAKINYYQGTVCMRAILRYVPQATVSFLEGSGTGGVSLFTGSSGAFDLIARQGAGNRNNFNGSTAPSQVALLPTSMCESYGPQSIKASVGGVAQTAQASVSETDWSTNVDFGSRGTTSLFFTGWLVGFASYPIQITQGRLNALTSSRAAFP